VPDGSSRIFYKILNLPLRSANFFQYSVISTEVRKHFRTWQLDREGILAKSRIHSLAFVLLASVALSSLLGGKHLEAPSTQPHHGYRYISRPDGSTGWPADRGRQCGGAEWSIGRQ
jgi:hypothetical protein